MRGHAGRPSRRGGDRDRGSPPPSPVPSPLVAPTPDNSGTSGRANPSSCYAPLGSTRPRPQDAGVGDRARSASGRGVAPPTSGVGSPAVPPASVADPRVAVAAVVFEPSRRPPPASLDGPVERGSGDRRPYTPFTRPPALGSSGAHGHPCAAPAPSCCPSPRTPKT